MPSLDLSLSGLINVDKPSGVSSRAVVDIVARVAHTRRAGHAGTLDPLATGVLVVCVGWATRLVSYVQQLRKRYRAEFLLGRSSDTDDVTGDVRELAGVTPPARSDVAARLCAFVGRIRQVPPSHSAVHVGGRRAYELARRGEAVDLCPREVDVYRIELVAYEYPRLELDIECGSGTYVRAIGRDLGQALGCGAIMSRLERRAIGEFRVDAAVQPESLTESNLGSHLLPPLAAVRQLPQWRCTPGELVEIRHGRGVRPDVVPAATTPVVAIVDPEGALAALAEYDPVRQVLQPRQVFTTGFRDDQS